MSKTLQQRVVDAGTAFASTRAAIDRAPSRLSSNIADGLRELIPEHSDIQYWQHLLDARTLAFEALKELELRADGNDMVPFGSSRANFRLVRFLGVQAYVTTNWSLADRIAGAAGRIMYSQQTKPTQLATHFMRTQQSSRRPQLLDSSLRMAYGWPVEVSYALRNHFCHDGAQQEAEELFDAPQSKAGFRLSDRGWERIENTARQHQVTATNMRTSANWPSSPKDDLRAVLAACETQVDDALGVLLGTASNSLKHYVGFMLGSD